MAHRNGSKRPCIVASYRCTYVTTKAGKAARSTWDLGMCCGKVRPPQGKSTCTMAGAQTCAPARSGILECGPSHHAPSLHMLDSTCSLSFSAVRWVPGTPEEEEGRVPISSAGTQQKIDEGPARPDPELGLVFPNHYLILRSLLERGG